MPTVVLSPPRPVEDDATRRELLKGAGVLTLAGFLAACGSDDRDPASAPATRSIDHALGTAQVPVDPQRVVAVTGTVELDCLVAVGVTPVAAAELETGVGFSQQVADQLADTVMLGTRREIDLEAVAAQRPDLVVGTVGWVEDIHPRLGRVAPTVAVDDSTGWRDITRQVAAAVGREGRAEEVIAEVDGRIEDVVDRAAGRLEGRTYTLMVSFASEGEYGLYRLTDDVDELLGRLGMVRPEQQLSLFSSGESYAAISTEQVELIDTDVIFLFAYEQPDSQAEAAAARADRLFQSLPAAQAGRVFTVDSDHWYFATPQGIEQVIADLETEILPVLLADS